MKPRIYKFVIIFERQTYYEIHHPLDNNKMNLPQAKISLEKIITLYKVLSADEKNISPIERDLMLSYVRQLYETFLETPAASAPPKSVYHEPAPSPKPEPIRYAPPPPEPVKHTPPPQPPVHNKPVEEHKPIVEPIRHSAIEHRQEVVEQPKYTPPPPPLVETPRYAAHNVGMPSDIAALFEGGNGSKELSDRLSNTAIADLSKAFGLNDRLLTQNELFGGSKTVFDEALKDLNNMSSFETAKNVIVSMAAKYNWTASEERKKQAKSFIKLVRRRFS